MESNQVRSRVPIGTCVALDGDGDKSTKIKVEGGSNRDVLPPSCLPFFSLAISINYLCCRWNICSQNDIIVFSQR